ncbi:MAG: hypothetical protein WD336_06655 [Trueperaceae bacterium]
MPNDHANRTNDPKGASRAAMLYAVAAAAFIAGGLMAVVAGPPPSEAPTLGMLQHSLWAVAVTLLAVGTFALVRNRPALREGSSGLLALGSMMLGVVVGVQWVTWAYVDLRASADASYEQALATIITPFGAGQLMMYAIFVGAGFALLGRALARSGVASGVVGTAGIAIGGLTVLAAVISIFFGLGGGHDGTWIFDAATLLIPVGYLWATFAGFQATRRSA